MSVTHGGIELGDARLRDALDAMPHKVWLVRLTGPAIYYNPAMRTFAGSALDLPERTSRERALIHPDDLDRFSAARATAFADKQDWVIELRMRCPDDHYRWHRLNFSVLRDPGTPEAWLVTATDIDDLHRALVAAVESEAQLRLAAEAAQLGIYTFDLETGEHVWSADLKRIFGLPLEGSPPPRIVDLIHPDDRARFKATRAASLDPYGDGTFQDEHRIIRGDGSERWLFVKGTVFFDDQPTRRARRGLGLVLDVTERKLAERALAQSETRYRLLFEHANDIVATLELDGRIVSINPAAREILGYEPEELIGKTIYEFVPREQIAMQEALLKRKIEGETSTQYDLEVVTKDRRRRILGINSRLIFDISGNPAYIHTIARDITERKNAEVRQQVLVRELQHRTKNLLAVVQAIASSTLKPHPDVGAFVNRLHALAHAQEFVTSGPGGGVSLRALIEAELDTFGQRAQVIGEDVILAGDFAQSFALVIHELATNAIKHGAFSSAKGAVSIDWHIEARDDGEVLRFSWTETGGPVVRAPTAQGFGTQLISTIGRAHTRFDEPGFSYVTEMPIAQILKLP